MAYVRGRGLVVGPSGIPKHSDEEPRKCTGDFLVPYMDATTRRCNRCGTEVDADEPALLRAMGQHEKMPNVPIGPQWREPRGAVRLTRTTPSSSPPIYIKLGFLDRLRILVRGHLTVVMTVVDDGSVRKWSAVRHIPPFLRSPRYPVPGGD